MIHLRSPVGYEIRLNYITHRYSKNCSPDRLSAVWAGAEARIALLRIAFRAQNFPRSGNTYTEGVASAHKSVLAALRRKRGYDTKRGFHQSEIETEYSLTVPGCAGIKRVDPAKSICEIALGIPGGGYEGIACRRIRVHRPVERIEELGANLVTLAFGITAPCWSLPFQ